MKKFRLGIVGTGLITAGSHLPAALGCPNVELTALVDPVLPRAVELARPYGLSVRTASDVRDVLKEVDGVIIATPNATHCSIALTCVEAGVHALIEKPLANTVEEGTAIADAAKRNGIVVAAGFCTRFRPSVRLLKELLDEGYFGRVRRFVHQFGTSGGWAPMSAYNLDRSAAGGGVLVVTGTHFLDRMLHFWGFPREVRLLDDGVAGPEANCTAYFQYSDFEGIAKYSKTAPLPAGLAIETDKGIVVLGDSDEGEIEFFPGERPGIRETIGRAAKAAPPSDVFQLQLLDFVDACVTKRKPLVDARQGVESIRLAEALYSNRLVSEERLYD